MVSNVGASNMMCSYRVMLNCIECNINVASRILLGIPDVLFYMRPLIRAEHSGGIAYLTQPGKLRPATHNSRL